MKLSHWTYTSMLGGLLFLGAQAPANADAWNKKTYVTTSQSIEVPGAILPPGKYVFKLLDSASNRHIVQILNAEENHVYTTNLAIPQERMEPAGKTILTFYEMPGGGPEPVRSWFYPGDTIGQEFAYPKKRAMEIAQFMKQTVPVLAESHPPAETPAPPPAPQPSLQPAATAPAAPPEAQSETEDAGPAPAPPPAPEAAAPMTPPDQQPAAQQPPAADDSTPAEPKMPQTAGNGAEMGVLGISCLALAASLRVAMRRSGGKS